MYDGIFQKEPPRTEWYGRSRLIRNVNFDVEQKNPRVGKAANISLPVHKITLIVADNLDGLRL